MLTEVDCGTCKHLDTDICFDCKHYEDRDDLYELADPATLKKREERRRAELEEKLEHSLVEVGHIPEDFEITLTEIKNKFSGLTNEQTVFVPVHAGKNFLSASNGFVLAKLLCPVPEELRGKNVIRLEQDGQVRVFEKAVPWQDKEENFICRNNYLNFSELPVLELVVQNKMELMFPDVRVLVDGVFWDRAVDSLEGPVTVHYGDQFDAVTLEGRNGFVVIMPLRS